MNETRVARPTNIRPRVPYNSGSEYDWDGDATSADEEAQNRKRAELPKRANSDQDWETCTVETDCRTEERVTERRARLKKVLDAGEEPVLACFLRFFPLAYFLDGFAKVSELHLRTRAATDRHNVSWTKGTFLRFLGILLHFTATPVPNIRWHWAWPEDLPKSVAPTFPVSSVMSYAVYQRYWRYMVLPGIAGSSPETHDASTSADVASNVYTACQTLLKAAVNRPSD